MVLALLTGIGRDLRDSIVQLSGELHSQQVRNVRLEDSVARYQVALDSRIHRTVALRQNAGEGPELPVGGRVSSGFTRRRLHPLLQVWRPHRGIDIPARAGTLVHPVVPGRVSTVGRSLGYGLYVVVDHGGGVSTRYAHLRATHVRRGQSVMPDVSIGEVGSTGFSTAPHLHYELMQHGNHLDPLRYSLVVIESVPSSLQRVAARADTSAAPSPAAARSAARRAARSRLIKRSSRIDCAMDAGTCASSSISSGSLE